MALDALQVGVIIRYGILKLFSVVWEPGIIGYCLVCLDIVTDLLLLSNAKRSVIRKTRGFLMFVSA